MAKAEKAAAPAAKPEAKVSKVSRGVVAKKEEGDNERARKYPETLKLKVLNKENPHREGSKRALAFQALLDSKTMGDYYESGHKVKYIGAWIKSGHLADFADAA